MKFATAACFTLAGLQLLLMTLPLRAREWAKVGVSTCVLLQLGFMIMVFMDVATSGKLGFSQFLDAMLQQNKQTTEQAAHPELPSLGTLLGLTCVGLAGLCYIFGSVHQKPLKAIKWLGVATIVIGSICLLGYIIPGAPPLMRYFHPRFSTGMAIHTAFGFVLLGMGMIWSERQEYTPLPLVEYKAHNAG